MSVYHKNLTGTDLHVVKPHAGSHFGNGNDVIHIGSLTGQIAHGSLADIGTSSHVVLDSHVGEGSVHFSMAEINHGSIANKGTYTHTQLDAHIDTGSHAGALTSADKYIVVPFLISTTTLTNMLAADTELPATQYRLKLDLLPYGSYRTTFRVATQGTTNAKLRFQYSSDDSSYADLDAAVTNVSVYGTGQKDSGWLNMAAGAKISNCYIRMMGCSGDGVADPVVRQVHLHFK